MSEIYAPIIIPTLNRFEHFKRCVESLSRNTLAGKTELIIGLDYPPSEKYFEGYNKIKEYICQIQGFVNVHVLTTDKNLNTVENTKRLIEFVRKRGYEYFIYTEDDNEFSPIFLEYVNWGLQKFKNSDEIFAICAHRYLVNINHVQNNIHKSEAFSAWGYGTWLTKFDMLTKFRNFETLKQEVNSIPFNYLFNFKKYKQVMIAAHIIGMLYKKYTLGDVLLDILLQRHKMMCVFPKYNLVRNWGIDGSGLHSGNKGNKKLFDYYSTEPFDQSEHFIAEDENNIPILPVISKYRRFSSIDKTPLKIKIYNFLVFFFYKRGFYFHIERIR